MFILYQSIALILEFLHKHNIIYRDLKLENILIDTDGYIKLTDFGFAKKVKGKTYTLCGTPAYLSPEIVTGKGHDKGADYWALGILLYVMLCRYFPFDDSNEDVLYDEIINKPIAMPSYFSKHSHDLIKALCQKNPAKRLGVIQTQSIKSHSFFQKMNFQQLLQKKVTPPYIPEIESNYDLQHFQSAFDCDSPNDSLINSPYDDSGADQLAGNDQLDIELNLNLDLELNKQAQTQSTDKALDYTTQKLPHDLTMEDILQPLRELNVKPWYKDF